MVITPEQASAHIKAEGNSTLEMRVRELEEKIDAAIKVNRNPSMHPAVIRFGAVPHDDLVSVIDQKYRAAGWRVRWCLDYNPPEVHIYRSPSSRR